MWMNLTVFKALPDKGLVGNRKQAKGSKKLK